jgi:hypothetical protein
MAEIEITSTSLVVQIEGFDRFLALISGLSGGVKARLEVPLEHVTGVDASVPEAHQIWKGWTVFALSLPRSVTVGRLIHVFGDRRGDGPSGTSPIPTRRSPFTFTTSTTPGW